MYTEQPQVDVGVQIDTVAIPSRRRANAAYGVVVAALVGMTVP